MRRSIRWGWLLCAVALCRPAPGMIQEMYSLERVLKECTHVFVGRIEKVDPKARAAVAKIDRALKGKHVEYARVNMNLGLGPSHHTAYLLERLEVGSEAIIFYQRQGRSIKSLVHAGDTWYQLFATDDAKKRGKVWWRLTHIEAYMGRTFDGTTAELIRVTGDVLARRIRAPKPNAKVPKLAISRSSRKRTKTAKAPSMKIVAARAGGFGRQVHVRASGSGEVRGVSFADVNGDELLDVLFCRTAGNLLLVNEAKAFKESARRLGLAAGSRAAAWADYNGDDHADLLTSNFELFTNVGGQLRNDSKLLKVPGGRNPEGAGWIDYNGDGLPDILVTNGEHGVRLYENTGKAPAWFRDVSEAVGLGRRGLGTGNGDFVAFFDYDADGYADFLYNLNDGILGANRRGRFERDKSTGIALPGGSGYKRGVSPGDYDNDGDLDLFVPAAGRARLYRNNNDGTFGDVAGESGELGGEKSPSAAAAWGDVNADGALDLLVCHPRGSVRLYLGNGQGRFADVAKRLGLGDLRGAHGAAFADLDGDGDLDLAVNLSDKVVVAYNDLPPSKGLRHVTVHVHARRGLVGATVRAMDKSSRPLGLRELNGAESCGGQACPVAHFALPDRPCRLSVALSDGRVAQKRLPGDAKAPKQHLIVRLRDAEFK